jgi:hypothetical protein
MKKVILLNSPPRSGKDYAANFIVSKYPQVKTYKFARILKERTHALYGFSWKPHDFYEAVKDKPNPDFLGLTPRQAYIKVSETYFKVHHGDSIFGLLLAKELDKYEWDIALISDSGFINEAEVLIKKYGRENIILIRITREGYDFSGDSRTYIYLDQDVCNVDIFNDGTNNYLQLIDNIVKDILNG